MIYHLPRFNNYFHLSLPGYGITKSRLKVSDYRTLCDNNWRIILTMHDPYAKYCVSKLVLLEGVE